MEPNVRRELERVRASIRERAAEMRQERAKAHTRIASLDRWIQEAEDLDAGIGRELERPEDGS